MKMRVPPFAVVMAERMKTKGPYKFGGPKGAIVHFTAGRGRADNVIRQGVKDGYAYWCIDRATGQLYCAHDADQRGAHCGQSKFPGLSSPCHNDLIGIEIIAAGTLTDNKNGTYKPWYAKTAADMIPAVEARHSSGEGGYPAPGWYHTYTPKQEATLIDTLLWLAHEFPETFEVKYVLGHDEVSGMKSLGFWRKTDPGAALSMGMPGLRDLLKRKLEDTHAPLVS